MKIKKKLTSFLFLLFFTISLTTGNQLDESKTRHLFHKILQSHFYYHALSTEILQRTVKNFIELLDPSKVYFLAPEIQPWTCLSNEDLEGVTARVEKGDFSDFTAIYQLFLKAIERQRKLFKTLDFSPSTSSSFTEESLDPKNLLQDPWPQEEVELKERMYKIFCLQKKSLAHVEQKQQDFFFSHLEKMRFKKEEKYSHNQGKNPEFFWAILKSFCQALDPQTTYFTPFEAKQFLFHVQQSICGIGVQLKDNLNGFLITQILQNGPPLTKQFLKENDRIIAVDNKPVIGMDITEAIELIRGKAGSSVEITVMRSVNEQQEEEKYSFSLKREEIFLQENRLHFFSTPFGNKNIGTIHLLSFFQDKHTSSSQEIKEAIQKMESQGKLDALILDLRGNGGGLLAEGIQVCSLFMKRGPIVSTKDNLGKFHRLRNYEPTPFWEGVLVVLIDRSSASCAEIVAQTLQDYKIALIVGEPSFGKGSYQRFTLVNGEPHKVNALGEYKVTQGLYYTPSGKSPQLVGVKPDMYLPCFPSSFEMGEKFTQYPLQTDQIPPFIEDDLSDLSLLQKLEIESFYFSDRQKELPGYSAFMPILEKNQRLRQEKNNLYHAFYQELSLPKETEKGELLYKIDPVFLQTLDITKDLLLLKKSHP